MDSLSALRSQPLAGSSEWPFGPSLPTGAATSRCCGSPVGGAQSPLLLQQVLFQQIMQIMLQVLTQLMKGGRGTGGGARAPLGGGATRGGDRAGAGAASPSGVKPAESSGRSIQGLDPLASDALRRAGLSASDVTQGLGHAAASKGTHEAEPGSRHTGSVDIRTSGRSTAEIKKIVHRLRAQGFAAWYRNWPGNQHIHAVYAGIPLKGSTSSQVQAFLQGGTGLAGGGRDSSITPQEIALIRALYQARRKRVAVRP